jgi:hypothetical protein
VRAIAWAVALWNEKEKQGRLQKDQSEFAWTKQYRATNAIENFEKTQQKRLSSP